MSAAPATDNFRTILGIRFFAGPADEAVQLGLRGGLVVVPSAPVLVTMVEDPPTCLALLDSKLALTDSGLMVILWNLLRRDHVQRVSGLEYLHLILQQPALTQPGATFWIMPNQAALTRCFNWLTTQGFLPKEENFYLAPFYGKGAIQDPALLEKLTRLQPRHIFTAVGGGTQERLGNYLQENLPTTPASTASAPPSASSPAIRSTSPSGPTPGASAGSSAASPPPAPSSPATGAPSASSPSSSNTATSSPLPPPHNPSFPNSIWERTCPRNSIASPDKENLSIRIRYLHLQTTSAFPQPGQLVLRIAAGDKKPQLTIRFPNSLILSLSKDQTHSRVRI